MPVDKYQKRYLKHQEWKKIELGNRLTIGRKKSNCLEDFIRNRRSRRIFKEKVDNKIIDYLIGMANFAPSSCNRHGVEIKRASRKLIKLLVGGKGWCAKGTVLSFYADMRCYKSPYEKEFMPYLDTGFMAQNIYLICEKLELSCCFINPNTRNKYTSKKLLCGAMAIGSN